MPSEEYKHSLPATPTRMSQRSFKGEGHELGSPNNRTDMSLPSVWRQKSVDVLNRAAIQRKSLAEHRAAYWKYNEEVRRAQYSMQIQVRPRCCEDYIYNMRNLGRNKVMKIQHK